MFNQNLSKTIMDIPNTKKYFHLMCLLKTQGTPISDYIIATVTSGSKE